MEIVDHVFNLIARFLHEGAISEYLRPAGPGIGCRKVLLDEEPQFQCTNCPLRVLIAINPIVKVNADLLDYFNAIFRQLTQLKCLFTRL